MTHNKNHASREVFSFKIWFIKNTYFYGKKNLEHSKIKSAKNVTKKTLYISKKDIKQYILKKV